jgi:hypothetical protein
MPGLQTNVRLTETFWLKDIDLAGIHIVARVRLTTNLASRILSILPSMVFILSRISAMASLYTGRLTV